MTGKINKNDIIYSEDKSVATAKFRIAVDSADSEHIRGNISFNVYNEAGISSKYSDKNRIIIIDTIAPDRTVTFSPAKQVVDSVIYYDDTVSARFEIKEANFYADDVNVYVNKVGEWICTHGKIPTSDIFSWYGIANNIPWTAHEWLSEVIYYLIFNAFGEMGMYIFSIGLAFMMEWLQAYFSMAGLI